MPLRIYVILHLSWALGIIAFIVGFLIYFRCCRGTGNRASQIFAGIGTVNLVVLGLALLALGFTWIRRSYLCWDF
jgi:uncharacterized membrane protein YbhN (UPF0104 family)